MPINSDGAPVAPLDESPIRPAFGARVRVGAVYRRRKRADMRYVSINTWAACTIEPRTGIYIGKRTIADGKVEYIGSEEGSEFCPDRHFPAALVVFSERERPVLVPFDALEVL